MNIGVLALQGDFIEHIKQIELLGYKATEIRKKEDLEVIDAIIIPGGESTTIGKLLRITGLMDILRDKIFNGLPVWGTCAGMILLAKEIENEHSSYISLMDIVVRRNAFGKQIDSFSVKKKIDDISENELELVFIRAPYILRTGSNVQVLCEFNEKIVAAREKNILVTSFHPELTMDTTILEYFIDKIVG